MVRVVLCLAAGSYLVGASYPYTFAHGIPFWFTLIAVYTAFSVALAAVIRESTATPVLRRYLANGADVFAITAAIISAGEYGIPFFVLYLWITLGNGFRFGVPALAVSAALCVVGFGIAVLFSEAWQTDLGFLFAVLSLLVVVPLNAARFLYGMRRTGTGLHSMRTRVVSHLNNWLDRAKTKTASASAPRAPEKLSADSRSDFLLRERGQAVLRVVVCLILTLYLWAVDHSEMPSEGAPIRLLFIVAYTVLSAVLALWVTRSRASLPWRRYLANAGDVITISYLMAAAGENGIPLFVLYLWVTFGNGFRFGIRALFVSWVLSLVGFASVVAFGPIWQEHPALIAGVFLALMLLPLYTGHLLRMLNAALSKAEEASAAKSQFLARMSHELRTPLNGIRGSVELLRNNRRMLPNERSLLDVIDDSVSVSLRQIDNVLDFSKLEAGKLTLEHADFDLCELLNSTMAIIRPAAAQKHLRLMLRFAPATPFALVGDIHHLRTVLLNLLSNAVKFTERGFVSLEVTSVNTTAADSARLRFEVVDTGIGISPAALPRIFDSFAQEDTGTTRRYGGTGLGTTISKQLVELMGGHIGVQSVKGRGTLFWFEVPFARGAAEHAALVPSDSSALLLSRDSDVTAAFKRALPQEQLLTADSEEAASELLVRGLRLGNPVHLIFVDQDLGLSASGEHRLTGLIERAIAANAPLIWVADEPPPDDRLRDWGYAATLPRLPESALVHTMAHASPYAFGGADPKVVSIAPWIWDDRSGDRPRILVADDNRTNLMITRGMLERGGYSVDTVENGDDAAERLTTGSYRLAVLDMHMPGFDGPEVARQYRMARPRSRLPIIVLTANVSMAAQQACAEAGADAYLSKPVTARKLLSEVKRLLDENTVEVLSLADARRASSRADQAEQRKDVVDVSVLAELDRIYRDPRQLEALVHGYAYEGRETLKRLAGACKARNHAMYCDQVHALKSNAANVGAQRLMEVCRNAESIGVVEFMRERDRLLRNLDAEFADSVAALQQIIAAPRGQSSD